MNASHGGGAFAQQRKSIKKKRERGSEIDSNTTNLLLKEISERGDDTTSMASGTKNSINIQVPLSHQVSNVGGGTSSAFKRINSNNAPSQMFQSKGGQSPDFRQSLAIDKHQTSKTKNQEPAEPNQSEIEAYLYKQQFIDHCKDILTRPKRKQQNINELTKQQSDDQKSVAEVGKFVHTAVKKTLHGDEKYEKMQQQH